jgi:putative metallohydrolase (TIGR04338 family)
MSQKQQVYRAEWLTCEMLSLANVTPGRTVTVVGSHLVLPKEETFDSLKQIQSYVDRVQVHPGVVAKYGPPRRVQVVERRGQTKAEAMYGKIFVPLIRQWAMREVVILHELAHLLSPSGAGHGPSFVTAHLHLMGQVMAPEVEFIHRIHLMDSGVKIAA